MTNITEVEAKARVLGHVTDWARAIGRETSSDEDRLTAFVSELLANDTVQLWMSMQVAQLTGQVH